MTGNAKRPAKTGSHATIVRAPPLARLGLLGLEFTVEGADERCERLVRGTGVPGVSISEDAPLGDCFRSLETPPPCR